MLLYTYISSHWRHVNITLHAHSSISINNESMYCDIDLIWCNISAMFFRDLYHRFAIFLPAAGSRLCRHMINALNIEKHMHIHVHVYGCSWHGLKQNRVVSHPIGLLDMWQNIFSTQLPYRMGKVRVVLLRLVIFVLWFMYILCRHILVSPIAWYRLLNRDMVALCVFSNAQFSKLGYHTDYIA